jgi:putative endonuclease
VCHPEFISGPTPDGMRDYYVYIIASKARGTLYIGVTNDISRRHIEHVSNQSAFTKKYHVHRLVYFEVANDVEDAINREKQLKNWHRQWKINLVESLNPNWQDLSMTYRLGPEINSG